MKVQVVRGADGEVLGAVAVEPNPMVFLEPEPEEGQQVEEVQTTVAELANPQQLFESHRQSR
jgi:hypothetical protein